MSKKNLSDILAAEMNDMPLWGKKIQNKNSLKWTADPPT